MIPMFTADLLASFFGLTFFDIVFDNPIQSGILNFLKLKDI